MENVVFKDLEMFDTGKFMWNFDTIFPTEFSRVEQALNWACAIQNEAYDIVERIRKDPTFKFPFEMEKSDRQYLLKKILLAKMKQDKELRAKFYKMCFGKEIVFLHDEDGMIANVLKDVFEEISLEGMLRVKDVIEHLSKFDPDACIMIGEMNAFDGGFWQHFPKDFLPRCIRSVEEDKLDVQERYKHDEKTMENILTKDYIYCKPNDVIMRF